MGKIPPYKNKTLLQLSVFYRYPPNGHVLFYQNFQFMAYFNVSVSMPNEEILQRDQAEQNKHNEPH